MLPTGLRLPTGLGLPSPISGGAGPPLTSLFSGGENGFLFGSMAELDELFTGYQGPTQVAADNDPCGFLMDDHGWGVQTRSQIIAAASEIVLNGTFDVDLTSWDDADTGTAVSSWASGAMRLVGTDSANRAIRRQSFTSEVGATYVMSVSGTIASGPGAGVRVGTTAGAVDVLPTVTITHGATVVRYFQALSTTTHIQAQSDATSGGDASIDNISVKRVSGNHAQSGTNSAHRALWKANGGKPFLDLDGVDDRYVSPFLPTAALTMAAAFNQVNVGGMLMGGGDSAGNRRAYLGLDGSGRLAGGWGAQNNGTIFGGSDIRNVNHVGLLTVDATSVDLWLDNALIYSAAPSGTGNGGTGPIALGAFNNAGVPATFMDGGMFAALAINRRVTPSEIANITSKFRSTYQ